MILYCAHTLSINLVQIPFFSKPFSNHLLQIVPYLPRSKETPRIQEAGKQFQGPSLRLYDNSSCWRRGDCEGRSSHGCDFCKLFPCWVEILVTCAPVSKPKKWFASPSWTQKELILSSHIGALAGMCRYLLISSQESSPSFHHFH